MSGIKVKVTRLKIEIQFPRTVFSLLWPIGIILGVWIVGINLLGVATKVSVVKVNVAKLENYISAQ